MSEMIGKELELRSYLLSTQEPSWWSVLLLIDALLGAALVLLVLGSDLERGEKLRWALLGFPLAPLALPAFAVARQARRRRR